MMAMTPLEQAIMDSLPPAPQWRQTDDDWIDEVVRRRHRLKRWWVMYVPAAFALRNMAAAVEMGATLGRMAEWHEKIEFSEDMGFVRRAGPGGRRRRRKHEATTNPAWGQVAGAPA